MLQIHRHPPPPPPPIIYYSCIKLWYQSSLKEKRKEKGCFCNGRHEHVRPLLNFLTGCQSKKGFFSKKSPLFCVSLMAPCRRTCHHVCLYTLLLALSVSIQIKKTTLSWARWKLNGFGYRSFSVQTRFLCLEQLFLSYIRDCSYLSQFKTSLLTLLFTSDYSKLL